MQTVLITLVTIKWFLKNIPLNGPEKRKKGMNSKDKIRWKGEKRET